MTRILQIFIAVIAILLLQTKLSFAKQVTKEGSLKIAQHFYFNNVLKADNNLKSASSLEFKLDFVSTDSESVLKSASVSSTDENPALYYVYNVGNDQGFVIVSGDDRTTPVLGYSNEGKFEYENIPEHVKAFMDNYKNQVKSIIQRNDTTIVFKSASIEENTKSVEPLIKTKWGQGSPYNSKIRDNKGPIIAPAGCVATAMAQVMNYHKWPINGTSQKSYYYGGFSKYISADFANTKYDWANMLNYYWTNSDTTLESSRAVATLMFHCGVSVGMKYEKDGSGAFSEDAKNALVRYFGYDSNMEYITPDNYTPSQWKYQMIQEIDANRPVLISGRNNEIGHAYIADGYDRYNFIHLNWGWDGIYNGYFEIDPLDGSTYYIPNSMIIGIQKPVAEPTGISLSYQGFNLNDNLTQRRNLPISLSINVFEENLKQYRRDIGVALFRDGILDSVFWGTQKVVTQPSYDFSILLSDNFEAGTYQLIPVCKSLSDSTWTEIKFHNKNKSADIRKSENVELVVSNSDIAIFQNSKTMHCSKGDFRNKFSYTDWENIQRLVVTGEIDQWDLMYMAGAKSIKTIDISGATIIDTEFNKSELAYGGNPSNFSEFWNNCSSKWKDFENTFFHKMDDIIWLIDHRDDPNRTFFTFYRPEYKNSQIDVILIGEEGLITIVGHGIMADAFSNSAIEQIYLPENLKYIAPMAFAKCPNLKSISLPDSIGLIGDSLFYNCENLKEIKFSNDVSEIWSQGFDSLKNVEKIILPKFLKKLDDNLFNGCEKLSEVKLPDSLLTIGIKAFYSCKSLRNIELPSFVDTIKSDAFYGCNALSEILSYNAVPPTILGTAFQNVPLTIPVHVPIGCKNSYQTANGWKDFINIIADLSANTNKTINNPIAGKLSTHFSKIEKSTTINLTITGNLNASDFTFIRDSLVSLTTLNIAGVKLIENKIPDNALFKESSVSSPALTNVILPNSLTSIGNCAFKNCRNLKNLFLPKNLISIGDGAFEGCSSINEFKNSDATCFRIIDGVVYNSDVTSLILYPAGKSNNTFTIPPTVTTLENFAFCGSKNLTSIELSRILTRIGNYSFTNSNKLEILSLPASIAFIGEGAFNGCSGLTQINTANQLPPTILGDSAFNDVSKSIVVKVPYGFGKTYRKAPGWKDFSKIDDEPITKTVDNNVAGKLYSHFSIDEMDLVNKLIVTGDMNNNDFSFIKNNLNQLSILDITGTNLLTISSSTFCKETRGGWKNLKSVLLPLNLTSIGFSAFGDYKGGCGITSIDIPSSVKTIENRAFYSCDSLLFIKISKSVNEIGGGAFYNCYNIREIYTENPIPIDISKSQNLFSFINKTNCILRVPVGSKKRYIDADQWKDFKNIVEGDFIQKTINIKAGQLSSILTSSDMLSVNNLTITGTIDARDFTFLKDSVIYLSVLDLSGTEIIAYTGTEGPAGKYKCTYESNTVPQCAFRYKTRLTSVSLPSTAISIGSEAFSGCAGLTSVTIPPTVISIGYSAFKGCKNLNRTLTFLSSVKSIGNYAFSGCSSLTGSLIIPSTYTSIEKGVFMDCSGLTGALTIPSSINSIGSEAFKGCSGLTGNLVIPQSVKSIDYSAFSKCSGFTGDLIIPSTINSISSSSFEYCSGLTSINIPYSVKSIGPQAFQYCSNLTSISIPSTLTEIGNSAFAYCSSLKTITLPNAIKKINESVFQSCTSLTFVSIPLSVTSVEYRAFSHCTHLTSLTLKHSVKSIGNQAFAYCTRLNSVFIPESIFSIGDDSFIESPVSFNVEEKNPNYSSINGNLFNKAKTRLIQCSFSKTSLVIPSSVTSASNNSLTGCYEMASIYLNQSSPLPISYQLISYIDKGFCVLHVPIGTLNLYKSHTYWGKFVNIVDDINPLVTTFTTLSKDVSFNLVHKKTNALIQLDWGNGELVSLNLDTITTTLTKPAKINGNSISIYSQDMNSLNVSNKKLTDLMVSKTSSMKALDCSNNHISILNIKEDTSLVELDCRNNKLTFATLPQINSKYSKYLYAPQTNLPISTIYAKGDTIDLSLQFNALDINNKLQITVYNWKTQAGKTLVSGSDYTMPNPGKFIFKTTLDDSVYCEMTNAAFPDLADDNIFRTSYCKISNSLGELNLSVSSNSVNVSKEANSTISVDITSNTSWSVSSDQAWLTINPVSGTSNGKLTFTALANPTIVARTAIVTVMATGVSSQIILVTQEAGTGTGVSELTNEKVKIYPNPVTNCFYVDGIEGTVKLVLTDLNGRVHISKEIVGQESISIGSLSYGVYFVTFITDKGSAVRKLVKE